MRLVNRRFVPFFFDLSSRGFAGDPKAREFVVKAVPVLGGRSVPTPQVLFMTPDGKVVAEESNYASAEQFIKRLKQVMRDNPVYMKATEAETALMVLEDRAQLAIDLLDYARARKELVRADSPRASYLRGHLDRLDGKFDAMKEQFAKVTAAELRDDVRMESAYALWSAGEYEALKKALAKFPTKSNRYSEARYYEGLALFHLGQKSEAQQTWAATIKGCPQDAWIYRADWAYCQSKSTGGAMRFSSSGSRTSLLNRIGYMGRKNPDLNRK